MSGIEDLDDFMCAYDIRVTLESDGEGGIDVTVEDIGGEVVAQLWADYCDPDENL